MLDLNKILNELTDDDVIKILTSLGCTSYINNTNEIIFQTICHNEVAEDGSMKLYYYKKNKRFHCYTHCSETFNLYTLIEKVFCLHGGNKVETRNDKKEKNDFCFFDTVKYVIDRTNFSLDFNSEIEKYKSEKLKYKRKNRTLQLPTYSNSILDIFDKTYPIEWINDGISYSAMDAFNIRYSTSRNKIIIPHYNIQNQLIGIRGRALNKEEVELYGKYMPIEIENIWYNHPLSQNLYGLNLSKEIISKKRKAVIFEGEKSCLLYYGYFGKEDNISVACCGSSVNKTQVDLLIKNCNLDEIIIAFDKEYVETNDEKGEKYFNKLYNICKKYNNYVNFSFIFDRDNLLELKDSPVDKGIDIYKKLYSSRVKVK